MRILVLEDDDTLRGSFARRLRADGYAVDEVVTLAEARGAVWNVHYDGLVLDRIVPDGDSVELVAELRDGDNWVRVLLLSGLGEGEQRVEGLRAGADDYMPKPVGLEELSLRVTSLLVRAPVTTQAGPRIDLGRVVVDRARRQVTIDGRLAHLSPTQYALLEYMAVNRHRAVPADELLEHCWDSNRDLMSNHLHPHFSRMRTVFGDSLSFVSVRGEGYVLQVPNDT